MSLVQKLLSTLNLHLWEKGKIYLFREIFYDQFESYIKKDPVNGQLSTLGPCWGTWRGFVYWDFWEKKKMHIWVPLSWTQRTLKGKSGGHMELQQGTGLHWAGIRLWGTKGLSITLRWIGTIGARTQCKSVNLNPNFEWISTEKLL